tara:strand:+ start:2776 stop:2934 length:159 start_codon:yes stop_codon:yes gene_type:complete
MFSVTRFSSARETVVSGLAITISGLVPSDIKLLTWFLDLLSSATIGSSSSSS